MSSFDLPKISCSSPRIKKYTHVHWKHVLAFKQQIIFMHLQQFSVFPNQDTIWLIISTKPDHSVIDLTSFLVAAFYSKLHYVIILIMKAGRESASKVEACTLGIVSALLLLQAKQYIKCTLTYQSYFINKYKQKYHILKAHSINKKTN